MTHEDKFRDPLRILSVLKIEASVGFLIRVTVQLLNAGRLIMEAPAFSWSKLELNHPRSHSRVESSSDKATFLGLGPRNYNSLLKPRLADQCNAPDRRSARELGPEKWQEHETLTRV